ncbi:MAG: hypothetical protein GY696_13110, partial [Gammaproteobacteria bacterium]|nr:hypothetical protein [Gammaproteobacteria bacterium]
MRQQQEINWGSLEAIRRKNELKGAADIQLKDMPVFDGSEGFALVKFFHDFDKCRSAGQWGNVSALSRLKFCLRGIAVKEFESAGPFDDVEHAKNALFDRFLQEKDRVAASVQLEQLRQLENESVLQYFDRFDAMADIAYGDDHPVRLKAVFLNGLRSRIMARHVQREKPQTIMDALRFAREEETFNQIVAEEESQIGR